ncbi:hypothetical protein ACVWXN_000233 [Bradyrhizobium sp. i1.4.4]|uniref:Uncharacterized protein n=1 Tax=Bradyrhizobium japonicum TaxID=375 RepID=A0A1Y2JR44_BRAJP|nr:hypothetical protein [Bradyrhizobium japonicum]OSJ33913.1 hypothetical protein BSZ19_14075 [Bradyrhizobium japonicum]
MPDVGHILFQGWTPLLRTAIGTTVTYVALEDVGAIVLEADGTFSVIRELGSAASALADIPELGGSSSANRSSSE